MVSQLHIRSLYGETGQTITYLTLWCPVVPHGYSYKASYARPG